MSPLQLSTKFNRQTASWSLCIIQIQLNCYSILNRTCIYYYYYIFDVLIAHCKQSFQISFMLCCNVVYTYSICLIILLMNCAKWTLSLLSILINLYSILLVEHSSTYKRWVHHQTRPMLLFRLLPIWRQHHCGASKTFKRKWKWALRKPNFESTRSLDNKQQTVQHGRTLFIYLWINYWSEVLVLRNVKLIAIEMLVFCWFLFEQVYDCNYVVELWYTFSWMLSKEKTILDFVQSFMMIDNV